MAVRCLPAARSVQPLADRSERDVAEEEPRGLAGLRLLLRQSAGQVVIAAGLGTLPDRRQTSHRRRRCGTPCDTWGVSVHKGSTGLGVQVRAWLIRSLMCRFVAACSRVLTSARRTTTSTSSWPGFHPADHRRLAPGRHRPAALVTPWRQLPGLQPNRRARTGPAIPGRMHE